MYRDDGIPILGVDTETTGLYIRHGCRPYYVSTFWTEKVGRSIKGFTRSWEWNVDPKTRTPIIPESDLTDLRKHLARFGRYVLHNAKFDKLSFESIDVELDLNLCDDSYVGSHLDCSQKPHGLKELSLLHLDIEDDDEKLMKEATEQARKIAAKLGWAVASLEHPHFRSLTRAPKAGWWVNDTWMPKQIAEALKYPKNHPWRTVTRTYADQDAKRTYFLMAALWRRLEERGLLDIYHRQLAVQELTYRMECGGLRLHQTTARENIRKFKLNSKVHAKKACRISGIENAKSHPQIAKYLYEDCGIEPKVWTKTGNPSVGKEALRKIVEQAEEAGQEKTTPIKFIRELLISRVWEKSASYLKGYLAAAIYGSLFFNLNVCGTGTTRLAGSNPNPQNVGSGKSDDFLDEFIGFRRPSLRDNFGPAKGRIWAGLDYQQQQLVAFAHIAKDQRMMDGLARGENAHEITARIIFGLRDDETPDKGQKTIGKNCNFGFIFGASPRKIERTANMPGLWPILCERMPTAHAFMEKTIAEVRQTGIVHTLGGYPLVVSDAHKGVNYIVQGTEGEIVKLAMLYCDELLRSLEPEFRKRGLVPGYVAMQVHDEIVFDLPDHPYSLKVVPLLIREMVRASEFFGIPASVGADIHRKSWSEGEKFSAKAA